MIAKGRKEAEPSNLNVSNISYGQKIEAIRSRSRYSDKIKRYLGKAAIGVAILGSVLVVSSPTSRENDRDLYYVQQGYEYANNPTFKIQDLKYQIKALKADVRLIAYEVNGLTEERWWYQAGLAYTIADGKFKLVFQIWDDKNKNVLDFGGRKGFEYKEFNGPVNEGDRILIELKLGNLKLGDDSVYMIATDLDTGALARVTFSAQGTGFIWSNDRGRFTGVMTEVISDTKIIQALPRQEYYNMLPYKLHEDNLTFFQWKFELQPDTNKRRAERGYSSRISVENKVMEPNFYFSIEQIGFILNNDHQEIFITGAGK